MSQLKKIQKNINNNGDKLSSEDDRYMKEKPSRYEVASYVNSLLEKHYMPVITNYIQMSSMVIQAILLEKGICTGDEIKKMTEQFVAENQKRMEEQKDEQDKLDKMENGLVGNLYDIHRAITMERWKFVNVQDKDVFAPKILKIINAFVELNSNSNVIVENLKNVLVEAESMKSQVELGTSRFVSIKYNVDFTRLMTKVIDSLKESISNLEKSTDDGSVEIKPISTQEES